ncbi:DUF6233 domain-containing protein [Streptomyces sp. NPDC005562]|uniref:DUF6233 domain-containing protein n=1 Tax=Streptomyces sp. NPDC005562 TaxID=3154890 RepID=UPI0033BBA299
MCRDALSALPNRQADRRPGRPGVPGDPGTRRTPLPGAVRPAHTTHARLDRFRTDQQDSSNFTALSVTGRPSSPVLAAGCRSFPSATGRPRIGPRANRRRSGCHMAGKHTRGADADQARQVSAACRAAACAHCRPDTPLGVLD